MAVAIVLGVLAGAIGFMPLVIGLRMTKTVSPDSNFGPMAILMLCLLLSFVILFVAAILCVTLARDLALPFALAEAVALCVVTIGFGISRIIRK